MVNFYVYNIVHLGFAFKKVPWLWADDVKEKLIEQGHGVLVE